MRAILGLSILATVLTFAAQAQTSPAPAATPAGCPAPGERPFRPGGGSGVPPAGARPPQSEAPPRPAGPPRKRLLLWADTRNGIAQHDIAHAEAVIEELGYKSGLYDTWIRTDSNIIARRPRMTTGDPASGGPSLCNVDAIFFLGHREIDLDPAGRADLLWFVHDAGRGFIAVHTGIGAFMSWPEFGELVGSRYDEHPWNTTDAALLVVDPKFPGMEKFDAAAGLSPSSQATRPGTPIPFHDEFYQLNHFAADQIHVVLRLDTSGLDQSRPGVHAGDSYAQAYAKMYGNGRVFYSGLGHAPATWDDPRIQDMYLGAIKWALKLTEADVTPNPTASPATAVAK